MLKMLELLVMMMLELLVMRKGMRVLAVKSRGKRRIGVFKRRGRRVEAMMAAVSRRAVKRKGFVRRSRNHRCISAISRSSRVCCRR